MNMELSPLARERLARIGALSEEEKERLRQSRELDSLLSHHFSGELDTDGLWKRLKALDGRSSRPLTRELQNKLIDTLRLQMNLEDFEQRRAAILAAETIKSEGRYGTMEMVLNSLEALRREYTQVKAQAYEQLRANVERQLQTAAQQAKTQGMNIDLATSVEANVKNSTQWKDFVSQHDESSQGMFNSYIAKLREVI